MREILFKAKRLDNGEWVEGWYCEYPFRRWPLKPTIIPAQLAIDGTFEFVDVDPSTVCQYTGLTDKNGKKIFEGDKLRCYVPIYKLGQKAPVGERWLAGTVIWDESSVKSLDIGLWTQMTRTEILQLILFQASLKSSAPSTTGRADIEAKCFDIQDRGQI